MLNKRQHYLQIALNGTLNDARDIISQIPLDKRIIIEAGTPLIKTYGVDGIKQIRRWWEQRIMGVNFLPKHNLNKTQSPLLNLLIESALKKQRIKSSRQKKIVERQGITTTFDPYIVADLKCMDRGETEVKIAQEGGADAITILGGAPTETLDILIQKCEKYGLDSMVDMMNVEFPLKVLRMLKKPPQVIILHRGVDEEALNVEKEIPFHEIQRIKSNYDVMIAVAGGDTFKEAQRAIFNDADIVVVWKSFYNSTKDTAELVKNFLKEVR